MCRGDKNQRQRGKTSKSDSIIYTSENQIEKRDASSRREKIKGRERKIKSDSIFYTPAGRTTSKWLTDKRKKKQQTIRSTKLTVNRHIITQTNKQKQSVCIYHVTTVTH